MNQYTNLNLYGHLALELGSDNSASGTINNVSTSDISFLRFTSNENVILTGLNPGYNFENNKVLIIVYMGTGSLTVSHLSTSSISNNRIYCPNEKDLILNQYQCATLIYDSYSTTWRVLSVSTAIGGDTSQYTNEPTGFPVDIQGNVDRSSSQISFNESTREFSISPSGGTVTSYVFLVQGVVYEKTTTESITINSDTGTYYVYFDDTGTLTYSSTFDLEIIYKYAYVSILYWNNTQGKLVHFGDERHGCTMDGHTHARIHQESGAVYVNGSALSDFAIDGNGTSNTHTQFSISSGQIRDEDILHSLTSKSSTQSIPVLYRVGTEWRSVENANQKFHYNTRAYYNLNTAGSYSLSEVGNNKYCLYHILSTNDKNNPYFSLMGINQYDTKSDAREGALTEITQYSGLPFVEFVFIGTIIFECKDAYSNTGKSIIVSTDTGSNYVDWRFSKTLNPSTASVNIHNNLGAIQGGNAGNYYHSNQPINTDSNVSFNEISSSTKLISNYSVGNEGGEIELSLAASGNTTLTGKVVIDVYQDKLRFFESGGSNKGAFIDLSAASNGVGSDLLSGGGGGGGGISGANPETINMNNINATINLSSYSTTSFRIKNPAQITLSNGTNGLWYTFVILSDGSYSFTSEVQFPLNNTQPVPSSSGRMDIYSFHCITTDQGTKYLATFGYDYSGMTI